MSSQTNISWRDLAEGKGPWKEGVYPAEGWREKSTDTVFAFTLHASDSGIFPKISKALRVSESQCSDIC